MKNKVCNCISKFTKLINKGMSVLSILFVLLLPLLIGTVFLRLLSMTGVPKWFYFLVGVLFFISLCQDIYFVVFGSLGRAIYRCVLRLKQNIGQGQNAEEDA